MKRSKQSNINTYEKCLTFLSKNPTIDILNFSLTYEYLDIDVSEYKYIDEELKIKIFYEESSVIDDYDEMFTYLKRKGFSCAERKYEK